MTWDDPFLGGWSEALIGTASAVLFFITFVSVCFGWMRAKSRAAFT